ncbi:hypothetical protein L1987_12316 [Smallanthus sonchifolius]|uniref:Uncharacterized protein n=1 Tax=Smallanthus sonchifolius TaxID=185202 RepID=A0ACB9JEB5_9ASTR|nr:hypothetical protein L1987_12316 [Smallanthus sonchifolius]
MEPYKVLFCLFLIPLHSSTASNDCPTSYCGQSFTEVRFPFRLINQQPENCSLAGIDLRCASNMMIINLLRSDQPYDDGFTSQLDEDITLTWAPPDYEKCEAPGGSCGYVNNTTQMTPGGSSSLASLAIACFMCMKDRRNVLMNNRRSTITAVTPEDAIAPPNVVGLDQATIESYAKVVLGESKRLPGHDDAA